MSKKIYRVVCEKDSEDSLGTVGRFDKDSWFDFVDTTVDGDKVYEVHTEYDIDRILDTSNGVVSYTELELA